MDNLENGTCLEVKKVSLPMGKFSGCLGRYPCCLQATFISSTPQLSPQTSFHSSVYTRTCPLYLLPPLTTFISPLLPYKQINTFKIYLIQVTWTDSQKQTYLTCIHLSHVLIYSTSKISKAFSWYYGNQYAESY